MSHANHIQSIEQQRVWRDVSEIKISSGGYVVWEIFEVIGEPHDPKYFEPTLDGGYILIGANFFFTREQADTFTHFDAEFNQSLILIEEMKEPGCATDPMDCGIHKKE